MSNYTSYDQWTDDTVHMATNIMDAWLQQYGWGVQGTGARTPADDVWDVFTRFRNVDPAAVEQCIAELSDVDLTVASQVNLLANAKDSVDRNWSGPAADHFCEYLNNMQAALNNLRDRLQALMLVASAELEVACAFQTDVRSLVQTTLQGIEDAQIHRKKMQLAIAGAIVSVAGAVTGGVLTVATAATITAGAAAVASEELEASDVNDVVLEFIRVGNTLAGDCAGQGMGLIAGLNKVMEYVTEDHLPEIRPDRPEVITAPSFDPKAFYPEGADSSTLPSVSTTDLVPEPAQHGDQQSDHVGGEGRKDITIFGNKVGEIDTGPARDLYPEQGPAA